MIGLVRKTYDGTGVATLTTSNYQLTGVLSGDVVQVSNFSSGVYDTKHAGLGKLVTVNSLALKGSAAPNYVLAASSVSANIGQIDARLVTVSLTGSVVKLFDGTTLATLAPVNYGISGFLSGDAVSLNDPTTGTYDTPSKGTGKTVTVTGLALLGAFAGDYVLSATTVSGAVGVIK